MDGSIELDGLDVSYEDHQDFEHVYPNAAAVLVILMGVSGFVVNAYILYRIVFKKVFGRLFGWMWISRGISLLISSFIDIAIYGPSLALYPDIYEKSPGMTLARVLVIITVQAILANLLIASNRCLLIRKPLKFKSVFTPKKTAFMIGMAWILPVVAILSIQFLPFCEDVNIGSESIPVCFLLQIALSVLFAYLILIITFVIDFYAIWKLRQMSKIRTEVLSNHLSPRSKRKQLNLCYMIILQSLVAVPSSFIQIVYDSIFWNIVVTLDGLIVIYFNDDLRPWRKVNREQNVHRVSTNGSICSTVIE